MAVKKYIENGKELWMVYINIRNPSGLRKQKKVRGFESEKAALAEEKRLLKSATEEIIHREVKGSTWADVIYQWEIAMRREGNHFPYRETTIKDYASCLNRWTEAWLKTPASQLNRADGRAMLSEMEREGKSRNFRKNVKYMINVVYKWGIEERLIPNANVSPVEGVKLTHDPIEKVPDIFTIEEIRALLHNAKLLEHPWYPVWAMALLTGMRNGELNALLWTDVDLDNRKLTVSKSYNTRTRSVKSTKAGYWRTVPISDELHQLLSELKLQAGNRPQVLPRLTGWDKGEQARILRKFCIGIGIRAVCFHSLRACFATQLLANDIAPARVMKICGWRDLKTMQHYVRLAGIDERGATQVLKVLPSDAAVMAEVVNIFSRKGQ